MLEIKEITNQGERRAYEVAIHVANSLSSGAHSSFFLLSAFENFEEIGWLPKDSIISYDQLSPNGKFIYILNDFIALLVFLSLLKSNDRLIRKTLKIFSKKNINSDIWQIWEKPVGKITEGFLSITTSLYMSFILGLNIYNVLAQIIDIFAPNVVFGSVVALSSIFCLWAFFRFENSKNRQIVNVPDSEVQIQPYRGVKILFQKTFIHTVSFIYSAGLAFLYINMIRAITASLSVIDFSFNPLVNNLDQNIALALITLVAGIPTLHVSEKSYFSIIKKEFGIKDLQPQASNSKAALAEQIFVASLRALVMAFSVYILIFKAIEDKMSYFVLTITIAGVPAFLALLSNFINRASLYIGSTNEQKIAVEFREEDKADIKSDKKLKIFRKCCPYFYNNDKKTQKINERDEHEYLLLNQKQRMCILV